MQQTPQMVPPMMSSFPPANITTEQIQKFLDENKKLILAILDNQNLGKLAECAQYQALLQKNLMYLAAIADAQPQTPAAMPPQMGPHPGMQGGYLMQHPQAAAAAAMAQQQGMFSQRMPLQFNSPHHLHDPMQLQQQQQQLQQQQQHMQGMQAQMGIRPGSMHPMHSESPLGSSCGPANTSKHDVAEAGTGGSNGHGGSASGHGDGNEESK